MKIFPRVFTMCPLTCGLRTNESINPWVAWHSPHSLTWSWIVRVSWVGFRGAGFVWWRGGPNLAVGLRRIVLVSGGINNHGLQWDVQILGLGIHWSRQRPMWFRDLYREEQARQDDERHQARLLRQFGGRP